MPILKRKPLDDQLFAAIRDVDAAKVIKLLAAGADANGYDKATDFSPLDVWVDTFAQVQSKFAHPKFFAMSKASEAIGKALKTKGAELRRYEIVNGTLRTRADWKFRRAPETKASAPAI